jgi:hypothetical protein
MSAFALSRRTVQVSLWNAIIVGALIALLAIVAERRADIRTDEGLNWAIAGVSLWLIIAPFTLGYDALLPIAMWNDVIVGVVALVLTLRVQTIQVISHRE